MGGTRPNAERLAGGFVCLGLYVGCHALFSFNTEFAGPSQGIPTTIVAVAVLATGLLLAAPRWTGRPWGETVKGFSGPVGGTLFVGFLTPAFYLRSITGTSFWFLLAGIVVIGTLANLLYAGWQVGSVPIPIRRDVPASSAVGAPARSIRASVVAPTAINRLSPAPHPEVAGHVQRALAVIEDHVEVTATSYHVAGAGSEGPMIEAVGALRAACDVRRAAYPYLRYALASALAISAQSAAARTEMGSLAAEHPDLRLARWALERWETWRPLFALPDVGVRGTPPPPPVSEAVLGCTVLPVRRGIEPLAVLYFRDRGGDLTDLDALRSARVEVTMVLDDIGGTPVAGVFGQVWDRPNDALGFEAHLFPLASRAGAMRRAVEHLAMQTSIDVVVLSADDRVLLDRRVVMPSAMEDARDRVVTLLDEGQEQEYQPGEIQAAIAGHQRRHRASAAPY